MNTAVKALHCSFKHNALPDFRSKTCINDLTVALCAAVALGVIIFSRTPPLTLTYDSLDYLAASENIQTYLHGTNADGFPYLLRPPLVPAYLHFFDDRILAAALLNCCCLAITLFVSLRLGRIFSLEPFYRYAFFLSVVFSFSFLQLHLFLWTEALFTAIISVLFYCVLRGKSIVIIILLLILAFFTRKSAGFVTLGVIAILVKERKFVPGVAAATVMGIVFTGWELLSVYLWSFSTSGETWGHHIGLSRMPYADSLTSWVLPRDLALWMRITLLAALLSAAYGIRRDAFKTWLLKAEHQNLLIFWFAYSAGIFLLWGAGDFDHADRFLSVVLPFVMLSGFSLFSALARTAPAPRLPAMLSAGWMLYPVSKTLYYLYLTH